MPDDDDALLERALEIALSHPEGWRRLVPELVAEYPETRVADLAAAIARAALAVEESFAEDERDGLPGRLYRLAALSALEASRWRAAAGPTPGRPT